MPMVDSGKGKQSGRKAGRKEAGSNKMPREGEPGEQMEKEVPQRRQRDLKR